MPSLIKWQDQYDRICSAWVLFWKLVIDSSSNHCCVVFVLHMEMCNGIGSSNLCETWFDDTSIVIHLKSACAKPIQTSLCACAFSKLVLFLFYGKQILIDLESQLYFPHLLTVKQQHKAETLLLPHVARCTSSLCSQYQLSHSVIRSSPKTHFLAERPDLPLKDKRDVKRHVQLGVDHNCDPQRCGPVIENTLADTQPPRWFTVSWWFSLLWDLGVRDNGSLCCHSLRWMRHERSWKGAKPGV